MCLVVFGWKYAPGARLALAGNRDEFHARPTAPLSWWRDQPLLAGRDLSAGGTWLGIDRRARFGVVTNFRGGAGPANAPSRGTLIPRFLTSGLTPRGFLESLATEADRYAGFSLLLGDADSLAYFCNRDADSPRTLGPGIYGLSNATLDAPWPKLVSSREALKAVLATGTAEAATILGVLGDRRVAADGQLPDTGVGRVLERQLSAAFIVGADYGTRSGTALVLDETGHGEILERSYRPDGGVQATVRIELNPAI